MTIEVSTKNGYKPVTSINGDCSPEVLKGVIEQLWGTLPPDEQRGIAVKLMDFSSLLQ